ncbi:NusG domain II-containing protein [Acutalibacter caecimuris]|uniref:NusG domain II-containing protein n=1 Tax=Acutalibacter caecimuris TaxID=3093657 RepID=UPI002AC96EEF|nr:NusG domain II-containing protein [Acutalibacter sp. M00118]
MDKRRLFSPKDWPVYTLVVLVLAGLLIWQHRTPPGAVAILEVDGQAVARRTLATLSRPEPCTVTGQGGISLTVEFSPDGARFLSSGCPDQTCCRTGLVSRTGETAVCLPARAVLRIEGGAGTTVDAETY